MIPGPRKPGERSTLLLIAVVWFVSVAAFLLSGGKLGIALAPAAAIGVLYLVWRLPLHLTGAGFFCLMLGLERIDDAANVYHTPLLPLGLALSAKFSVLTQIKPLQFTGGDLLCLLALLIALARSGRAGHLDTVGKIQAARPLATCAGLFALTVVAQFVRGLASGGDLTVALWQIRTLVHIPFYFLVFQACIRGPVDFPLVGWAMVLAASMRAALCLWMRYSGALIRAHPLEYVTSHDDSMTFALALVILLVQLNERTTRRTVMRALIFGVPIVWATLVNARRLAWVDLGFAVVIYALLTNRTRLTRAIARSMVVVIPVVIIYVAVGWTAEGAIFGPVHLVRSVVSSSSDRSTLDRDVENWNLATSVQTNPLLGRGLGHEYDEKIPMDDISQYFSMYRALPHNSILGLWCFFGLVGILGLWPLLLAGLYLGARAYRFSQLPDDRTAAYASVAAIVIVLNQSYGDMAFWGDVGPVLIGMALAVAGKAAVGAGAWPAQPVKSLVVAAEASARAAEQLSPRPLVTG